MLKSISRRIFWVLLGRFILKLKFKGFSASPLSFAYRNCRFSEYNSLHSNANLFNTSLGRFTYVAGGQICNAKIGSFTSIGPEVKIGGLGKHPTDFISTHPVFYSSTPPVKFKICTDNHISEYLPVVIGNDVWIGAKAIIMDGVTINDGAVIGAGSIVTKDVLPYEMVAGVPAKTIRFRFSEEERIKLEKTAWWDRDVNFYLKNAAQFRTKDVSKFIESINF